MYCNCVVYVMSANIVTCDKYGVKEFYPVLMSVRCEKWEGVERMSIKSDSQFVIKQVVDTLFASETAKDNDYLKEIKPEDRKRVRKYIREQDEKKCWLFSSISL